MPHLILSVSQQLATHKTTLLKSAHEAMLATGIAPAFDVKSRVVVLDDFLVGEQEQDAFAHIEIRVLQKPDRTDVVQKAVSDAIMVALAQALPPQNMDVQLSCEIVLMNPQTYGKQKVVAVR